MPTFEPCFNCPDPEGARERFEREKAHAEKGLREMQATSNRHMEGLVDELILDAVKVGVCIGRRYDVMDKILATSPGYSSGGYTCPVARKL